MTLDTDPIVDLASHPDADVLGTYDHPVESFSRWRAVLTAKAWIGRDLGCFFADAEYGFERAMLIFPADAGFRPEIEGIDMRTAATGSVFDLDVVLRFGRCPAVVRAEQTTPLPAYLS